MALLRRRNLGSRATQIAFDTLHTVTLMGPALREGLTGSGVARAVKQLRATGPLHRTTSPSTASWAT